MRGESAGLKIVALTALMLVGVGALAGMGAFAKKPPKPPPGPPPGADPAICYRPMGGTTVWAMDDDGSNRYQVSTVSHFDASWSPSGAHIAFDRGPGQIWRVDVDGANEIFLIDGAEPAWSPQGDVIAFAGDDWTTLELVPAEGGTPTTLHSIPWAPDDWIRSPTWNADGTKIAFLEKTGTDPWTVRVIEVATGVIVTIAGLPWADSGTHIDWARTKDVLLWEGGDLGIYTLDLATGQSTYVTEGNGRTSWSPDDTQCVFNGSVEVQGKGKGKPKIKTGIVEYTFATGEKVHLVAGSFADWRR